MNTAIKLGLVGLDTSHCVAFTRLLQGPGDGPRVPGARVTGLYAGGSPDLAVSRDRVAGFTQQLQADFGLPLYTSLEQLAAEVDALMVLSADGRQHLAQFTALAVGKPVFMDKPLATTTAEARALLRLAHETHTPLLSCSSLRFAAGLSDPLAPDEQLVSAEIFGPATQLPDFPGLFWYGVHGIDSLFGWLGADCQRVRTLGQPDQDVVVGEWGGGRLGLFRGTRLAVNAFGGVLHTTRRVLPRLALDDPPFYYRLMQQVVPFLRTGRAPVSPAEMFAVIAFIEAAHASRDRDGHAVELEHL